MTHGLVVFRRDLPGGHMVMISLQDHEREGVIGRLQIERRADPRRREAGEAPIVAEVIGASHDAVLRALRQLAEDDDQLRMRLDAWIAARPTTVKEAPRRVAMPDGDFWTVERRHEMTRLERRGAEVERRLFLLFHSSHGVTRRAPVPGDHPADTSDAELRGLWSGAEIQQ